MPTGRRPSTQHVALRRHANPGTSPTILALLQSLSRALRRVSIWNVATKTRRSLLIFIVAATVGGAAQIQTPHANSAPAPEVEYLYDVGVRRHYNFPNNDAIAYGHEICDKVVRGKTYAQVMSDVKSDVTPNDEFAANYLVSYAVNLLCPAQVWQLRNSAAHYQPPMQ